MDEEHFLLITFCSARVRCLPRPVKTSASLIGRLGSSTFRLSTTTVSMSLAGSCFSSESAPRPFHHGIRRRGGTIFRAACRQMNGRSKQTCELTSSIVPRGKSFHRSVELEFPSIGFDPVRSRTTLIPLRRPGSSGTRCRQSICGAGSRPIVAPERRSPFSSRGAWRSAWPRL